MFGQFDTTIFEDFMPVIGPIYLIIYLLISAIIFFNLLVALLTFIYEKALVNSENIYYLNLIR